MRQHYSPEEADAILGKALEHQPMPGDMTREQLVKLAEEVGVTPEQLESAEAEYRNTEETREFWDAYRAYRMRKAITILPILGLFLLFAGLRGAAGGDGISPAFFLALFAAVTAAVLIKAKYSLGYGTLSTRKLNRFIESRRRSGLPVPPGLTPWDS